jgi:subtilase family serine protease
LTVPFTIGGTAVAGTDYVPFDTSVTIPAGSASATVPVAPIDDMQIGPDETVVLSIVSSSGYTIRSPGSATVTILSDDVPPDLVVSSLTAPATGGANAAIAVTDTTLNQGKGIAVPSVTAFYLSTNTTLDAADVAIGSRSVAQLAAGASSTATTTLTIPQGTPGGTYYVIAAADSTNTNTETSETNNTRVSAAIKIGPDLTVSSVSVPGSGGAGVAITVTDTTADPGGGAAPASKTGYYLSTNTALDSGDVLLGFRSVAAIPAGGTNSGSASVVIPAGTTAGVYYVIAVADYDNSVSETNETNNTAVSSLIRIGPDLVETSASVSPTGGAGLPVTVTDTVKNQGLGDAPASTTGFYLSNSVVFTTAVQLIGTRPVPALPTGTSNTASTTLTLPSNLATGTYFIFVAADYNNQVAETFESNNNSFGQIVRVGPDLTVTTFTAPASIASGATAQVNSVVANQGGGAASASTLRVYLSTNQTLDSADVAVGSRTVAVLNPGQSDSGAVTITIPTGTAAGSYFLIAVADDGNVVPETNETNNTRVVSVTVTAGGM